MNVKEIRLLTGMTQREFAQKYRIPLQTIKQWESDINSTSYRKPPEYIEFMLYSLVEKDTGIVQNERKNYLIRAAEDSRYNKDLWFRYLRKEINMGKLTTDMQIINEALDSNSLTMFQKISLKRLLDEDSTTYACIRNLNLPASTSMIDQIRSKYAK